MTKTLTLTLILLLSLIFLSYSDQDVPLSKTHYGFSIGDQNPTRQITFFLDLLCPDSKDSYDEWIKVRRTIDLIQQKIKLTYQFNPLTWHYYSFKINQAFFYVLRTATSNDAEKFISYVFANQDDLSEENYLNKTLNQFLNEFAANISSLIPSLNKQQLRSQLEAGTQSFVAARYQWKYLVGSHAVPGAPLFELNGVRIDNAEDYLANDWINFLQQYRNVNEYLMDKNLRSMRANRQKKRY